MAHVQKFTRGTLGHMLDHYTRNKTIENVDVSRSHLNYNLAEELQPKPPLDFIHERLGEVKVQNRKDVNVMCDWVVTMPKEYFKENPEQIDDFFKGVFDFAKERYGEENIIGGYVHMDETTPHIHIAFMPIVYEAEKDREKLCAKQVITKTDLATFHKDLEYYLGNEWGFPDVGIRNEATKDGNKSIQDVKRSTAMETIAEQTATLAKNAEKIQKQNDDIKSNEKCLESLKGQIKGFEELLQVTQSEVSEEIEMRMSLQDKNARLIAKNNELQQRLEVLSEAETTGFNDLMQLTDNLMKMSDGDRELVKKAIGQSLKKSTTMKEFQKNAEDAMQSIVRQKIRSRDLER